MWESERMPIVLKPETEKLIEDRMRDGSYRSADEMICAALQALADIETLSLDEHALDAIDEAEDQIDRGECHDLADVRARIMEMFRPDAKGAGTARASTEGGGV